MIDIKLLRENPQLVQKSAKDKGFEINVKHILELDKKVRDLDTSVQKLREERNKISKEKNIEKGTKLKIELEAKEKKLSKFSKELKDLLYQIPNIPKKDVKVGRDESENEFIYKKGAISTHMFKVRDHLELGEKLDIIDVKSAAKTAGARFGYLKNNAVFLEFALVQLALEVLVKEGFIAIIPPALVRPSIMRDVGYMEQGHHEDFYFVLGREEEKKELDRFKKLESELQEKINRKERATILEEQDYYLIGTAEHSIVPIHKDEILNKKDLPKRYVGFSSSFRREAGSYGKDTRGIFRVHQFDKVEMVSFTTEENEDKEYDFLLSLEERLFKLLDIPYQVVKMCTGDLGFPAAAKKDIEAWMPGQNKYREVTSVSQITDFQSRRLNIKYQDGNEKKYAHILNGTAFAIGRTIIAILENNQQEDGSIIIPKVLQKYLNFKKISPKTSKS